MKFINECGPIESFNVHAMLHMDSNTECGINGIWMATSKPMQSKWISANAFVTVKFYILFLKLKRHKMEGSILKWLSTYLKGRNLHVVLNGIFSAPFSFS